jgi:hypothetical protein
MFYGSGGNMYLIWKSKYLLDQEIFMAHIRSEIHEICAVTSSQWRYKNREGFKDTNKTFFRLFIFSRKKIIWKYIISTVHNQFSKTSNSVASLGKHELVINRNLRQNYHLQCTIITWNQFRGTFLSCLLYYWTKTILQCCNK